MIQLEQRGLSLVYCLGSSLLFVSAVLSLMAFFSPYWTVSESESNENKYSNIGLWQICLYGYKHSEMKANNFKFETAHSFKFFNDCFWLWSKEIEPIKDRFNAPWFKLVQSLIIMQLIIIFITLVLITISYLTLMKFKFLFLFAISISATILSFIMFTGLLIFGANGKNKEWMHLFDQNYFSWSYWCQMSASFLTLISASFFYSEAKSILFHMNKMEKMDMRRGSISNAENEIIDANNNEIIPTEEDNNASLVQRRPSQI